MGKDTTIYVGNIDPRVTKEELYELFIQVGKINKIKYPKDKILQKYQGYAFIEFTSIEEIEYIIKLMHNTVSLHDRFLKIRKSVSNNTTTTTTGNTTTSDVKNQKIVPPVAKLFIKGLDRSITVKMLQTYFNRIGPFYSNPEIFSSGDDDDGDSANQYYAFIYYKDYKDADEAITKFNNQILANKQIQVEYAIKENNRSIKYGNEIDRLLNKEALKNGLL